MWVRIMWMSACSERQHSLMSARMGEKGRGLATLIRNGNSLERSRKSPLEVANYVIYIFSSAKILRG